MSLTHAFDLLVDPPHEAPSFVGVFGSDAVLRSWCVRAVAAEGDVMSVDGEAIGWSDISDDLATASLFDTGSMRTIVVRSADKFVSANRAELEKHLAGSRAASRLVLELDSLPANTKLYKTAAKDYLLIACNPSPDRKMGVTAASRTKFLTGYIAQRHNVKLTTGAADALLEMLGDEIGLVDTEIAKLSLYREPGGTVDEALVREVVAGWQGKTIWQITDAIAAGNSAEALRHLDKLMSGGQRPIALLPQIAWSLRRLGMSTAVVDHRERCGQRWQLNDALSAAGINRPSDVRQATRQLKRLGRERGRQMLPWLLDADLRLKGTHSQDGRDRMLLEQLVMRMAKSPSAAADSR